MKNGEDEIVKTRMKMMAGGSRKMVEGSHLRGPCLNHERLPYLVMLRKNRI